MTNLRIGLTWIAGRWEKILLGAGLICFLIMVRFFHQEVTALSSQVEEDMRFLQGAGRTPVLIDEKWVDGLIQRLSEGPAFAKASMRDLFSVQKDEAAGVVPDTAALSKEGRFTLVKIYREPVRLLFKGYLQLPDGGYSLQINWAGQTTFKKVGETIRGYRIDNFQKVIGTQEIQRGYLRDVDNSFVVIRKEPAPPVTLAKGNLVSEKELFAKLFDTQTSAVISVHVGSQIGAYKVLDITEDQVLLSDQAGAKKEVLLKRSK